MIAKVCAFTLQGLDAVPVEVEAGVYQGLPDLTVVGLPDAVLRESRERVRSAVVNSGYQWPTRRMLVNLAPAHIRKEGSGLDLAVGVSLLKASGQLNGLDTAELVFAGELSLDGSLRGTRGILAAALSMGLWPDKALVVPADNLEEARRGTNRVVALKSLAQLREDAVVRHMIREALDEQRHTVPDGVPASVETGQSPALEVASLQWNLSMVKGQYKAKRGVELAAAGGHHLLLLGPPGSGKSLMARCLQGILPPMREDEMQEVNRVYSAAGLLSTETPWIHQRPFRSPHAGVTKAGLLGGGVPFRPGEVSLAHRGVLFIDELPEMDRNCIESLRQPLEEGRIILSRAWGSVTLPAKIQLVASANPCPCGYFGEYPPRCKCLEHEIRRYQNRFSGPLLDRLDMVIHVPRLEAENLMDHSATGEDSRAVAARVARVWQKRKGEDGSNVDIEGLQRQLTAKSRSWALAAYDTNRLTARGYFRMLCLARTVADLSGEDTISTTSLAEALEYRHGSLR
jgi:magnesium chelatase family protein